MEYIAHRINSAQELKALPYEYGVELDLRDSLDGRIYIQHNPFEPGEDFEDYLKKYHHGTMILNIKSEGIEFKIREMLPNYDVRSYFFLDSSFPMIHLLSKDGERNIALRISEYEGLDTARNMSGRCNWIWVDCFTKISIDEDDYMELKDLGYRLCFVSPELEGRTKDIESYARTIKEIGLEFDSICTKAYNIDLWKSLLEA